MTIAADDHLAGLRITQFRPNDVHDALIRAAVTIEREAEFRRILLHGLDLTAGDIVGNRLCATRRRDVVVYRRYGQGRPSHGSAAQPQPLECLRRRNFMHKVQVNVEQRRRARAPHAPRDSPKPSQTASFQPYLSLTLQRPNVHRAEPISGPAFHLF